MSYIGFEGTRRPLSAAQAGAVRRVVRSLTFPTYSSPVPRSSFCTGDCPSGLDAFFREFVPAARVFRVSGPRSAQALRARTLSLVSSCSALFVFPGSLSYRRSGSWLAAFSGFCSGASVFVFAPHARPAQLPCCRGVSGWSHAPRFREFILPVGFFSPYSVQQSFI